MHLVVEVFLESEFEEIMAIFYLILQAFRGVSDKSGAHFCSCLVRINTMNRAEKHMTDFLISPVAENWHNNFLVLKNWNWRGMPTMLGVNFWGEFFRQRPEILEKQGREILREKVAARFC